MTLTLHEQGLRLHDEKVGSIMIYFKEMKDVGMTQSLEKHWIVFTLNENIFFSSLHKNIIAIQFCP